MKNTIFIQKDIEVLVVSAGGVGTTFLMEAISQHKKINQNIKIDGYKHLPIPPISFNKNLQVIYIFGDPIMASISLFRRQYHNTQSIWVQKYHPSSFTIPFQMNIDEYAKQEKDGHQFKQHMDNWLKKYPLYPTMFIKYENLYDSLNELADFLELPPSFLSNFPKKKERKSSINNLSPATIDGLKKMYSSYQKEVEQLPVCFKNNINQASPIGGFYFSSPYRKAFWKAFLKRFSLFRKILNKLNLN